MATRSAGQVIDPGGIYQQKDKAHVMPKGDLDAAQVQALLARGEAFFTEYQSRVLEAEKAATANDVAAEDTAAQDTAGKDTARAEDAAARAAEDARRQQRMKLLDYAYRDFEYARVHARKNSYVEDVATLYLGFIADARGDDSAVERCLGEVENRHKEPHAPIEHGRIQRLRDKLEVQRNSRRQITINLEEIRDQLKKKKRSPKTLRDEVEERVRTYCAREAMSLSNNNAEDAADLLGIAKATLYLWLSKDKKAR
jgi:hypothetical protein